jgi:hypothetical protein
LGSCNDLKADIKLNGADIFRREILTVCPTKSTLSYAEVEQQVKRDVLRSKNEDGEPAYYNGNIMGRFFSGRDMKDCRR